MSLKTGKCQESRHETWQPGGLTWLSAWEKQSVKNRFWVAPTKPTSIPSCQHGSRQGHVWGRSCDSGRFSAGPLRPKENSEKPWGSDKLQSILLLQVAAQLWRGPVGFISIPCQHIKILNRAFGRCFDPNQRTNRRYASPDLLKLCLLKGVKPSWNGGKGFIPITHPRKNSPVANEEWNPRGACNCSSSVVQIKGWTLGSGHLQAVTIIKHIPKLIRRLKMKLLLLKRSKGWMLAASN